MVGAGFAAWGERRGGRGDWGHWAGGGGGVRRALHPTHRTHPLLPTHARKRKRERAHHSVQLHLPGTQVGTEPGEHLGAGGGRGALPAGGSGGGGG